MSQYNNEITTSTWVKRIYFFAKCVVVYIYLEKTMSINFFKCIGILSFMKITVQ